jgi:DNA-binding protein H-NS
MASLTLPKSFIFPIQKRNCSLVIIQLSNATLIPFHFTREFAFGVRTLSKSTPAETIAALSQEIRMANKIDLSKLSLDDLRQLRKDVEVAISNFQERKRAEAVKALEAVAKQHGMSLDEIVGGKGKKRKARAPAKYANPDNKAETWSGRGRQPAWFKAAVGKGKKPESMAI